MRHFCSLVLISFIYGSVLAQIKTPPAVQNDGANNIYTFVDQVPVFTGGDTALIKFLQANVVYPKKERKKGIQGKVVIRFVVDETGKVTETSVLKSVSPGLDQEALRVVKLLPDFTPGKQNGKAVKVYFNLPIDFRLQ